MRNQEPRTKNCGTALTPGPSPVGRGAAQQGEGTKTELPAASISWLQLRHDQPTLKRHRHSFIKNTGQQANSHQHNSIAAEA